MQGVSRKMDSLGRVVIPKEYRKSLAITKTELLSISLENGRLVIEPQKNECRLCGEKGEMHAELRICRSCIAKIKKA